MEKFCTTTNSCFLGISDVENVQMEQGANSRSAIQQILDEIELAPVYRSTFKKKIHDASCDFHHDSVSQDTKISRETYVKLVTKPPLQPVRYSVLMA